MDELKPLQPRVDDEKDEEVANAGAPTPSIGIGKNDANLPHLSTPATVASLSSTTEPVLDTTTSFAPQFPSPPSTHQNTSLSISQPADTSGDAITSTHPAAQSSHLSPDALRQEPHLGQPASVAMADNQPKEGDKVSWQWSGGRPGGEVAEVKEGTVEMTTKNNNVVKKDGEPGNPAVKIQRSGHDVVKKANELDVEEKADGNKGDKSEEKKDGEDDKKEDEKKDDEKRENGDAETGDKRKAEETSEEKKDEEGGDAKKQKKSAEPKENGEAPKKKGRPAKKDANGETKPKKETKKKEPKRAATESGEPRRSGRNRS